jgi:hypothetical protein
MKLRLLRIGDHLDGDTVLVRGGELDAGVLKEARWSRRSTW